MKNDDFISSQLTVLFFPGREHNKTQHMYRHTQKCKRQTTTTNTNTAKQLQHKHAERKLHTQINHKIYTCIKINRP